MEVREVRGYDWTKSGLLEHNDHGGMNLLLLMKSGRSKGSWGFGRYDFSTIGPCGLGRLDIREAWEVREPGAMSGKNYMGFVGHKKNQKLANDTDMYNNISSVVEF